ncbi:MAG: protein kinase [Anaerolineae bacterium]|nr:protein kinase [Gemmatimonadaceae bacterium]
MSDEAVRPELRELAERYEFLEELGHGRTAIVYLARDRNSGRDVAIRVLNPRFSSGAEGLSRFVRVARTSPALQHPNIVQTLAVEELGGGSIAIVSEYVRGETLRSVMRASGRLTLYRATRIMREIAAALAHSHAHRSVHGDVRPENIFIEAQSGRAMLADFGIARALDGENQQTSADYSLVTPTYMSPEQVDGQPADDGSDVYALALVGWEMLTGRRPWGGEGLQSVLHKQKNEQLPSLGELRPDVPAFLLSAINGGLAKDARERWADAGEFLNRLTPAPVSPVAGVIDTGTSTWQRGARDDQSEGLVGVTGARANFGDPVAFDPNAPFDRNVTGEDRGSRRRWWPVAGALVGAALLFFVLQASGDDSSGRGGKNYDTALDSLLEVTSADSAAGGLLDAPTPTTRPVTVRDRRRKVTTTPAVLRDNTAAESASEAAESVAVKPAEVVVVKTLEERCASRALADQTACLLMHIEREDVDLTRVYQMLITALRRDAGGVREPAEVQMLRTEQRAWLAERDRICRIRTLVLEDPLWGLKRAPCFAEFSAKRTKELDKRLDKIMARSDIRRR